LCVIKKLRYSGGQGSAWAVVTWEMTTFPHCTLGLPSCTHCLLRVLGVCIFHSYPEWSTERLRRKRKTLEIIILLIVLIVLQRYIKQSSLQTVVFNFSHSSLTYVLWPLSRGNISSKIVHRTSYMSVACHVMPSYKF